MIKKIVGFGDSWMWGDELIDPALRDQPNAHPMLESNRAYRESRCFLGRLAASLDVPMENFGWPGASLASTRWCYHWWQQHETVQRSECLVLVALTDSSRHSFYNPQHQVYSNDPPWHRFVHSAWVHSGNSSDSPDWIDMVKKHMVLTDCETAHRLNWLDTAEFFQGQAARHRALLQFNTSDTAPDLSVPTLLWPGSKIQDRLRRMPNWSDFFAEHGHANETGHEIIHGILLDEIRRAILH